MTPAMTQENSLVIRRVLEGQAKPNHGITRGLN